MEKTDDIKGRVQEVGVVGESENVEGMGIEKWSSSALASFSECLGMSTKGFDKEVWDLLKRMERVHSWLEGWDLKKDVFEV